MSADIYNTLEQSQHELASHLSNISVSIDATQDNMIAQLDDRLQVLESRMLVAIRHAQSTAATTTTTTTTNKSMLSFSERSMPARRDAPPPYSKGDLQADPLSLRRGSPCGVACTCNCHHASSQSWRLSLFRSVIGMVAVAHSARYSMPCTNPACLCSQQQQQQHQYRPIHDFYVTYHLPSWLARTTVSAFVTTNLNGGPAMNLRVYNRRPIEETQAPLGAGRLIESNNVDALKTALRTGRISIYDIHARKGHTSLTVAVTHNRPEIVKLYLQAGSDPFHRDDYGDVIIATAFQLALSGVPEDKELGELFPISRYVDEADFTPLHRAVLVGVNFEGLLRAKSAECMTSGGGMHLMSEFVDCQRGDGWTALHLAAIKGDSSATRALLRAGADPNFQSKHGITPLYYACRYGHVEVAKVLLRSGADVQLRDGYRRQPIHAAMQVWRRSLVELLLDHGADLNGPGFQGYPPMLYAVVWGTQEAVATLIEMGADLSKRTQFGETLLMIAIRMQKHEKVKKLLSHAGPDELAAVCDDKRTILHFLANGGDEEMFDIFYGIKKWRGVNTSAKDRFGLTPLNLFIQRSPSEELREAFERLLDWVEKCCDEGDEGDEDDFEEQFFDAEDDIKPQD